MDDGAPWAWRDAVARFLEPQVRHGARKDAPKTVRGDEAGLEDIAQSLADISRQIDYLIQARRFNLLPGRQDAPKTVRGDSDFKEAEHPRNEGGKFTAGAGGGGAAPEAPKAAKKSQTFGKKGSAAPKALHGVAFASWTPPQTRGGWQKLADSGPKIEAPPPPPLPEGFAQGAGVIIKEPDGSVWVMHPKRGFGGYKATFPKGTQDPGLSLRATAIKEAYEETGLKVELTGFAGDVERSTSNARYYFARRVGGTPEDHGEEASSVTLAPVEELEDHLNAPVDRKMVTKFLKPGSETPSDHPPKEEKVAQAAPGKPGGQLALAGMTKTGGQLGSNPGGRFTSPEGQKYYVKYSKSLAHAKNELLASRLYEAAGSPILSAEPIDIGDGKLGTATKWKEGVKNINRHSAEQKQAAQENFATHAWLANWDAAGLEYDNQGLVDGDMTTLDAGGAMIFRAQGGPKGNAFGKEAGEWESLRSPSNTQAHAIYGSMSQEQLRESAKKVVAVPDDTIRELVESQGPGTAEQRADLAAKLIARKYDIAKRAGLSEAKKDAWTAEQAHKDFIRRADAWSEADHPRVPAGAEGGGQFTSGGGGGGKVTPSSSPALGAASATKKIVGVVEKALEKGEALSNQELNQLADAVKAYSATKSSSSWANYANVLLADIENQLGLGAGSLGKATFTKWKPKKKEKGGAPEAAPPSAAEMEAMAAEAEAPPEEPEAKEAGGIFGAGPDVTFAKAVTQQVDHLPSAEKKVAYLEGLLKKPLGSANTQFVEGKLAELKGEKGAPVVPDPPGLVGGSVIGKSIKGLAEHPSMTVEGKINAINTYVDMQVAKGTLNKASPTWDYSQTVIAALEAQQGAKPKEVAQAAPEKKTYGESEISDVVSGDLPVEQQLAWLKDAIAQGLVDPSAKTYAEDWLSVLEMAAGEKKKPAKAASEEAEPAGPELPDPLNQSYGQQDLLGYAVNPWTTTTEKIAALKKLGTEMTDPSNKEYAAQLLLAVSGVPKPQGATQKELYESATFGQWKLETKVKQLKHDIAHATDAADKAYGEKLLAAISDAPTQAAEQATAATLPQLPVPGSSVQKNMLQVATSDAPLASKIKTLEQYAQAWPTAGKEYGAKLIEALKGEKKPADTKPQSKAQEDDTAAGMIPNYVKAQMSLGEKLKFVSTMAKEAGPKAKATATKSLGELMNTMTEPAEKHAVAVAIADIEGKPPPVLGPQPHASSKGQQAVYAAATSDKPDAEKITAIEAVLDNPKLTGSFTKSFGEEWIAALKGEAPPSAAKPAAPAPKPAGPKPGTLAAKAKAAAPKTAKHGSLTAPANAQVLQARDSPDLHYALKTEAEAANPASTSSQESYDIVPSLQPGFWQKVSHSKDAEAIQSYGGGGYKKINGVQRGHESATPEALGKIDAMRALFRDPDVAITQDINLVRGEHMDDDQIKAIRQALGKGVGTYHYMRTGFTSASIGPKPGYKEHENVWWHFAVKKGQKVLGIAGQVGHHEREVILPHGVSTEVYEIYHDGTRTHIKALVG